MMINKFFSLSRTCTVILTVAFLSIILALILSCALALAFHASSVDLTRPLSYPGRLK